MSFETRKHRIVGTSDINHSVAIVEQVQSLLRTEVYIRRAAALPSQYARATRPNHQFATPIHTECPQCTSSNLFFHIRLGGRSTFDAQFAAQRELAHSDSNIGRIWTP